MKINTFSSLAFAAVAISLTTININQVNAATITYDITVNNLDGSLSGESFTGNFSFDDANLIGSGSEFLTVFDLSFDFLGTTYTENDSNYVLGAEAEFFDREFLGLSYSTDVEFSFVPGFLSLNDSFFAYDFGSGDNGTGDIVYTLQTSNPEPNSIPEPVTIIGLLTTFALGSTMRITKDQSNG